ncbi:MAG: VOC family protein, partial [Acidimicrobiales bacterium]
MTAGQPVVHAEILGEDPPALRGFYADVFGWTFEVGDPLSTAVSEAGEYGFVHGRTLGDGSDVNVGVGGGAGRRPQVLFYVAVPDVASALRAAERAGGARVMGPEPGPGAFAVGWLADPCGNVVGVAG